MARRVPVRLRLFQVQILRENWIAVSWIRAFELETQLYCNQQQTLPLYEGEDLPFDSVLGKAYWIQNVRTKVCVCNPGNDLHAVKVHSASFLSERLSTHSSRPFAAC